MPPTNSGSFGAALGGGSAIAEAMKRRGMNPGVLNQVSPAAPTFAGAPQPPQVGANPSAGIPRPAPQSPATPPAPPAQPMPSPAAPPQGETEIIVKALVGRLENLSKRGV